MGESFELETQSVNTNLVGLVDDLEFAELENDISEVQRMINGLVSTVESNPY